MCFTLTAQNTFKIKDTLLVSQSYANSKKKPLRVGSNTLVINKIDSLYLLNKARFHYYEDLKKVVNGNLSSEIENIVFNYEKIINDNNESFAQLEAKNKEQSILYEKNIDHINETLTTTETSLKEAQLKLVNTDNLLQETNEKLKKSKRKRLLRNFEFLGSGIGVGLLVGLLLGN